MLKHNSDKSETFASTLQKSGRNCKNVQLRYLKKASDTILENHRQSICESYVFPIWTCSIGLLWIICCIICGFEASMESGDHFSLYIDPHLHQPHQVQLKGPELCADCNQVTRFCIICCTIGFCSMFWTLVGPSGITKIICWWSKSPPFTNQKVEALNHITWPRNLLHALICFLWSNESPFIGPRLVP